MKLFCSYLRARLGALALFLAFWAIFILMAKLGGMAEDNIRYAAALCALIGAAVMVFDGARFRRRHLLLREFAARTMLAEDNLPESANLLERDYEALVRALQQERAELVSAQDQKLRDMDAYYTLWAHQIKTPIAAMRLLLQQRDDPADQPLAQELFSIEQYVEMALQYQRLGSSSSDFVIRRCALDDIVRQALRRYAPLFIRKKLALRYEPCTARVLTDEKWLLFVVEQVLSNALKYTNTGSITIREAPGPALVVEDTGIGIAPEDLPRVFDCGFTGYNGRADKKATGLGLYLCRRVCRKLSHTIGISSEPGRGTAVTIGLASVERVQE
jgi:signal transduction histidine kinase